LGRLGMAVSDDTILRVLKQRAPQNQRRRHPRIVGIDDWAWRRASTISGPSRSTSSGDGWWMLATRAADSVATWLAAHPSIPHDRRDRHGPYAGLLPWRATAGGSPIVSSRQQPARSGAAGIVRCADSRSCHTTPHPGDVPRARGARLVRRTSAAGTAGCAAQARRLSNSSAFTS
jgi:hypothetical protein